MNSFAKILAPVDFSVASTAALAQVSALAARSGAELVLLYVLEDTDLPVQHVLHSTGFPNARDEFRKGALAHLERVRDEVIGEGRPVQLVLREGSPAAAIVDAAAELEVDAVAMATHGRSGLSRLLLGSTTERVMRTAGCSVLVVRAVAEAPLGRFRKVLVPTDFSERSAAVIPEATDLARSHGAELILFHAIEPLPWPVATGPEGSPLLGQELRRAADQRLAEFRQEHVPSEVACRLEVRDGVADDLIVRFAESEGVDLIAMASEGHGGLKRFLLGTTTEKVVRHAPCSVLVGREGFGPEDDALAESVAS